jgi:hypothetical protein
LAGKATVVGELDVGVDQVVVVVTGEREDGGGSVVVEADVVNDMYHGCMMNMCISLFRKHQGGT